MDRVQDPFAAVDVPAAPRELIAVGGELDVATLVSAYRSACFPWPATGRYARTLEREALRLAERGEVLRLPGGERPLLPWCSPHPRAVLLADQLHLPRSLRQRLRHAGWTASVDEAFAEIIDACADRGREGTWITAGMRRGYLALHEAGIAHSVEVWDGDRLIGGLYGVLTGAVFSGESMFHRENDASKAAVVELCARMLEAGAIVVDTQQETPHLTAMGQVMVAREEYAEVVRQLRDLPVTLPVGRRALARLVD